MSAESVKKLDEVTIRLAGDSGDGMQLVGTELTNTSALFGNDVGTLPDYPAEIRAPIGTLAGVSGFQLHIGRLTSFICEPYFKKVIFKNRDLFSTQRSGNKLTCGGHSGG